MAPGEGQAIVALLVEEADAVFDADGDRVDADFSKFESSIFVEHGVSRRFTLVGRIAYQDVRFVDGTDPAASPDTADGLGASELAVRGVLAKLDRTVLSVQAGVLAPGDGENVFNAPLGDQALGGEVRFLAGRSWGGLRRGGFAEVQLAGRAYDQSGVDDRADEARLDLTLGVRPDPRWLVLAQTFSVAGLERAGSDADDFQSHKVSISARRRVSRTVGLQAGLVAGVAGRDAVADRAAFAAVWVRY